MRDRLNPIGVATVTMVPSVPGVSIKEALGEKTLRWLNDKGKKIPSQRIVRNNLVVNSGREKIARLLSRGKTSENAYINRLTIGVGQKSGNLPSLLDVGLAEELTNLSGVGSGTFEFDPDTEILLPSSGPKYPSSGGGWAPTQCTISISSGITTLTDPSAAFVTTSSISTTDQVTVQSSTINNVSLGVMSVVSDTQLTLYNPYGFSGAALNYRISTPGTQVLFSKFVDGNNFPQSSFGVATLITEAGLLFNDGTLFNRVVYIPENEDVGIVLQSDEATGVAMGARFEFLVTI